MKPITVAAWQMEPTPADVTANLARLDACLESLRRHDVDLLQAPEMFATGWLTPEPKGGSERLVTSGVERLAREHGTMVATSVRTRRGSKQHNAFCLWDEGGKLVGGYDKIHLWGKESQTTSPGDEPRIIKTRFGTFGGIVCYDVEFPEIARALAVEGAETFLVASAFYTPNSWDLMTRARALENGCFVVAANQYGGDPKEPHNGDSRIISPRGEIIKEIPGRVDGVIVARLDPAEVTKARAWAPFLRDRRIQFAR